MSRQHGTSIEIREVAGKKALNLFIRVPWSVYKNDPHGVPPLLMERKEAFSSKHPFFRHARWKAWIACKDGKPLGRI
jgi:mannosyltransferase OCH1-like enzyme